jgi:hypothetical protein
MDREVYPGDDQMKWLWKNSNLTWTGFYFPVGGDVATKLAWRGKFNLLKSQGWGVAPIYLGRQIYTKEQIAALHKQGKKVLADDPLWADLNGFTDGLQAAEMARAEGMPGGTIIYLDVEAGGRNSALPTYFLPYQAEWAKTVVQEGYRPGIYCSFMNAQKHVDAVEQSLGRKGVWAGVWAFAPLPYGGRGQHIQHNYKKLPEPAPGGCGFAAATAWQCGQECDIAGDRVVDATTNKHNVILSATDLDSALVADPGNF